MSVGASLRHERQTNVSSSGDHAPIRVPGEAVPARRAHWRALALWLFAPLAYLTIWVSLSPGAAGQWHAYRLLSLVLSVLAAAEAIGAWSLLGRWSRRCVVLSLFVAVEALLWCLLGGADLQRALPQATAALGSAALVVVVRQRRTRLETLIRGVAAGALIVIAMAGYQWSTGVSFETRAGRPWGYGSALAGPFVNPNNLAAHSVFMLGALLWVSWRNPKWRVWAGSAVGALFLVSAGTFSRSAPLGWAFLAASAIFVASRGKVGVFLPRMVILVLTAVTAALAAADAIAPYAAQVSTSADQSDSIRMALIGHALTAAANSFGVGLGPGGFEDLALRGLPGVGNAVDIHNSFVEMAVSYGFVPALLLVWTVVGSAVAVLRRVRTQPDRTLSLVVLSAAVTVLLAGITASSVLSDPAWWMTLAVVCIGADMHASATRGR